MVNHFRTLLLNESRSSEDLEQYIDPFFMPQSLSGAEAAVRNMVFRDIYPRAYKNFIATLLTRVVYGSEDSEMIDSIDPRSSIDLSLNQQASLQNRIVLNRQSAANNLHVVGEFSSDPDHGIFSNEWVLQKSGANVLITDTRSTTQTTVAVTFSSGTTGLYPIDSRSALYFQFINETSVPAGFQARVTATNPMQFDAMAALEKMRGEERCYAIFSSVTNGSSLHNTFNNSSRPDLSLAAILVAYCLSVSSRLP